MQCAERRHQTLSHCRQTVRSGTGDVAARAVALLTRHPARPASRIVLSSLMRRTGFSLAQEISAFRNRALWLVVVTGARSYATWSELPEQER